MTKQPGFFLSLQDLPAAGTSHAVPDMLSSPGVPKPEPAYELRLTLPIARLRVSSQGKRLVTLFVVADDKSPVLTGGRASRQDAPLAQLAEHLTLNQRVPGSSPGGCTTSRRAVPVGEIPTGPLSFFALIQVLIDTDPWAARSRAPACPDAGNPGRPAVKHERRAPRRDARLPVIPTRRSGPGYFSASTPGLRDSSPTGPAGAAMASISSGATTGIGRPGTSTASCQRGFPSSRMRLRS